MLDWCHRKCQASAIFGYQSVGEVSSPRHQLDRAWARVTWHHSGISSSYPAVIHSFSDQDHPYQTRRQIAEIAGQNRDIAFILDPFPPNFMQIKQHHRAVASKDTPMRFFSSSRHVIAQPAPIRAGDVRLEEWCKMYSFYTSRDLIFCLDLESSLSHTSLTRNPILLGAWFLRAARLL